MPFLSSRVPGTQCKSFTAAFPLPLKSCFMAHHHPPRPKSMILCVLILLGIALAVLLDRHALTGKQKLDGVVGVVFGLYMCSHPAAFIVDLLFFRRGGWHHLFPSNRLAVATVALNLLVLLIGWLVIFLGTTRLIGRAEGISTRHYGRMSVSQLVASGSVSLRLPTWATYDIIDIQYINWRS